MREGVRRVEGEWGTQQQQQQRQQRAEVEGKWEEGAGRLPSRINEPGAVEGVTGKGEVNRNSNGVAGQGEVNDSPIAREQAQHSSSSPPASSSSVRSLSPSPSEPSLADGWSPVMHEVYRVARAMDRVAFILRGELG